MKGFPYQMPYPTVDLEFYSRGYKGQMTGFYRSEKYKYGFLNVRGGK